MKIVDHPILELIESEVPEFIDTEEMPHTYVLRGKYLRGVSTVAQAESKPWLAAWQVKLVCQTIKDEVAAAGGYPLLSSDMDRIIGIGKKAPTRKKEAGAEAGTDLHAAIQNVIMGKEVKLDDALAPMVFAFAAWSAANIKQWLYVEQPVGDYDMGCAGTFDGLGIQHNGRLILADWKTNDSFPDDAFGKTAGYLGMIKMHCRVTLGPDNDGCQVNGDMDLGIDRVILWLPKNPEVRKHLPNGYLAVTPPFTFAQDWRKFVAMNDLAAYQESLKDLKHKEWVFDKKAPVDNDVPLSPPPKPSTTKRRLT